MIELESNGQKQMIDPGSIHDLRGQIARTLPTGHYLQSLVVNGRGLDESQLEDYEIGSVHSVCVQSATPQQIARDSLGETHEWIGRICGVCDSVSREYRSGGESDAHARLVDIADALQVLTSLLGGLRRFVEPLRIDDRTEAEWRGAESDLQECVELLLADLEAGDPIALADRTGHTLPRVLRRFQDLLERLGQ